MSEDLLYYVWSLKTFDFTNLRTTAGESIQIIDSGIRNYDAGPDFLQAKIKIGSQTWVGHVEMHVKSSDWLRHQHQKDQAFQNVILHVVYHDDHQIDLPNGEPLACLHLGPRIKAGIVQNYRELMENSYWIPCQGNFKMLATPKLQSWYERVLVERLALKTARLNEVLRHTQNDWEESFYRMLGRNFGFKVNADAFEALAISLPHKVIAKHKNKLRQIEALLFGQAGMLEMDCHDQYFIDLKSEYNFLRKKYDLTPNPAQQWKFMRMRPANFPTIRIAQFSVLLFRSVHLFSKMLASESIKEVLNMFDSDVSGYWKIHYNFDKQSSRKSKKLGKTSIELIIINTIVPFLFHYGRLHHREDLKDKALRFLEELKPESNKIVRGFESLGFRATSAFDTQALLQLKQSYCDRKRCLECAIGNSILKNMA